MKPRAALRRMSAAATSGSWIHASCNGITRSRCGPAHSSMCQSFHAPQRGEAEVAILALGEDRAREAGDQRREAERGEHPVDIHVVHAGFDVVATAPHLVEARRLHAPLRLRPPRDRVEADLRIEVVLVDPGFAAVVERDDLRARGPATPRGAGPRSSAAGSMRWSSTEMIVKSRTRGSGSGRNVAVTGADALGAEAVQVARRARRCR